MKRYLITLIATMLGLVLLSASVSAVLDPFSIVHPLIGQHITETDDRVAKLRFLLRNCDRYDGYFLGDSRAATLSQSDLSGIGSRRFYNFSASADNAMSIVPRLSYLLRHGCPVSAIVMDESIDVLMDAEQGKTHRLLMGENPAVSGENPLAFYSRYFLGVGAVSTYLTAWRSHRSARYVYYPDGHADFLWGMADGSSFPLPRCGVPSYTPGQKALLKEKLEGYRELSRLAARYQFVAIVWIAPVNQWERGVLDDPEIAEFRKALHSIPGLAVVEPDWNSPLLADFREWHDCGHFRRSLFDHLLAPQIVQRLNATKPMSSSAGVQR